MRFMLLSRCGIKAAAPHPRLASSSYKDTQGRQFHVHGHTQLYRSHSARFSSGNHAESCCLLSLRRFSSSCRFAKVCDVYHTRISFNGARSERQWLAPKSRKHKILNLNSNWEHRKPLIMHLKRLPGSGIACSGEMEDIKPLDP